MLYEICMNGTDGTERNLIYDSLTCLLMNVEDRTPFTYNRKRLVTKVPVRILENDVIYRP